jgi:NAD(P)-dependent dehydrogenase (short-subunit alcohol dehydrogenase family)
MNDNTRAGKDAVLITGAAGGMGLATARALLGAGYAVYGLDLREPPALEGLRFLQTDLTDPEAADRAAQRLSAEGVRLAAIVHMAGIYDLDSLVEMEEAAWDRIFQVNLFAAYRVNRAFLPLLQPGARILVTTSELAPLDPLPFTGVYAVTKAALDKYASSLRMELQLLGVRVIVLRPGAVDTPLLDVSTRRLDAFCEKTARYAPNAERFRRIVNRVEARRVPPERVAALAEKALRSPRPRDVYSLNRNPLLLLFNLLPNRLQRSLIRGVLRPKGGAE